MSSAAIALFGEVLFDCFPDGNKILGGAPFNVAWHLHAFGLPIAFISRVGNDAAGQEIRNAMQHWGMAQTTLQTDSDHPTGQVAITFKHGEPEYAILDQQAYDFIDSTAVTCNILYHGSLALRNSCSRHALQVLKQQQHQSRVFVDINLRSPWWHKAHLADYLSAAHWVKLNEDELLQCQDSGTTLHERMQAFKNRYQLQVLVVTCGEKGALALDENNQFLQVTPQALCPVVDTVGAGDAFAAVLLLGMHRQWSLSVTLQRAQQFASALVSQQGATVDNMQFYQPFIAQWQAEA